MFVHIHIFEYEVRGMGANIRNVFIMIDDGGAFTSSTTTVMIMFARSQPANANATRTRRMLARCRIYLWHIYWEVIFRFIYAPPAVDAVVDVERRYECVRVQAFNVYSYDSIARALGANTSLMLFVSIMTT